MFARRWGKLPLHSASRTSGGWGRSWLQGDRRSEKEFQEISEGASGDLRGSFRRYYKELQKT